MVEVFATPEIVAVAAVFPDRKITSPIERSRTKSVPVPLTDDVDAALIVLPVIP